MPDINKVTLIENVINRTNQDLSLLRDKQSSEITGDLLPFLFLIAMQKP